MAREGLTRIDAATFQPQLLALSETVALKMDREGIRRLNAPQYVAADLFILLRYAQQAFAYISFMNSDERRTEDIYWREQYSIFGLSAVRTLIDCLYTITTILEDPPRKGKTFRESGIKKFKLNLDEEKSRYAGRPEWQKHFDFRQELLNRIARETGVSFNETDTLSNWKTLGGYLRECYGKDNEFQAFLRRLTLGAWSDYSALLHASFEGLIPHGLYFARDIMRQEERYRIGDNFPQFITMHICRAAGLLLCILTEVQVRCKFDEDGSARINKRLHEIWNSLSASYEVKEFYDERYQRLMQGADI